jgi:hypothetical protein
LGEHATEAGQHVHVRLVLCREMQLYLEVLHQQLIPAEIVLSVKKSAQSLVSMLQVRLLASSHTPNHSLKGVKPISTHLLCCIYVTPTFASVLCKYILDKEWRARRSTIEEVWMGFEHWEESKK